MELSKITNQLYIGTTPGQSDYPALSAMGIRLIINMRIERPPYPPLSTQSLKLLWLPTIDSPLTPIPISILQRGVKTAMRFMEIGGGVYTHCASGAHRGVAMGAAILISQGYSAEEAMNLIKERRFSADPYIWYIRGRIERFAELWDHREGDG